MVSDDCAGRPRRCRGGHGQRGHGSIGPACDGTRSIGPAGDGTRSIGPAGDGTAAIRPTRRRSCCPAPAPRWRTCAQLCCVPDGSRTRCARVGTGPRAYGRAGGRGAALGRRLRLGRRHTAAQERRRRLGRGRQPDWCAPSPPPSSRPLRQPSFKGCRVPGAEHTSPSRGTVLLTRLHRVGGRAGRW